MGRVQRWTQTQRQWPEKASNWAVSPVNAAVKLKDQQPLSGTSEPRGEADFVHIYSYNEDGGTVEHDHFMDRVDWNGSKRSMDIQDASIYLLNVTFNDSGTYRCFFNRILSYDNDFEYNTVVSKVVHLTVVAKATRGTASIVSEVMMYVSIIGLQVWLLIEMIYCYRKIAAAGEEALREAANAEYLAIASESKDNMAGVQVGE
ncbi:hypothetical protein NQD34_008610 [Periophthalmus magnuspinnatus]|nr:hypothetical protein NQD34_008610 [Periophthalmus magnuspinnatus]